MIVAIGSSYWKDYNTQLVSMIVDNGVSPIEATCALQDDYGNNPSCIILAIEEKNSK